MQVVVLEKIIVSSQQFRLTAGKNRRRVYKGDLDGAYIIITALLHLSEPHHFSYQVYSIESQFLQDPSYFQFLGISSVTSVVSDSVQPHRWQHTRLLRPWDSPGKNTGVGCHFLLQCMKVKSESEVAQSCPTLRYPMDCSPPGFSVHGISQARVPEWAAIQVQTVKKKEPLDESESYDVLSRSVLSDSQPPQGLQPSRLLCPWSFSRQEQWSGLPCSAPGDIPNLGIEPRSPTLQEDYLSSEPPGRVKEESEKVGLKCNIKKLTSWHLVTYIMANKRGKSGNSDKFYFPGLKNHCGW